MNPLAVVRRNKNQAQTLGKSHADPHGTGAVIVDAEEDASLVPVWTWETPDGNQAARIVVYFDTALNIAYASYQGVGASGGDVGIGEIQGINRNSSKYGYIQVTSAGHALANLQSGSDLARDAQNFEIQAQTSDTGNPTNTLVVTANPTSAHGAGFGAKILIQADGTFQGAIYGSFTGAGTNADLYVQAEHSVKFAQGTTPELTGSWGGNAAGANLAALLETMDLIIDSSTA